MGASNGLLSLKIIINVYLTCALLLFPFYCSITETWQNVLISNCPIIFIWKIH